MKTKSIVVILGLVLMMVTSVSAQFLMGSKANAWGEPTNPQGQVIGKSPVVCAQPVVSGYRQIDVPAVVTQSQPVKKSVWTRIFTPPAEPETTVKVETFYQNSGNHVVRTTRTTVDKNSKPDYLAPPILQSRVPAEYTSSSSHTADLGGRIVQNDTQKRVSHDVSRYTDEHGWLITTVITTEEMMTYKGDYTYQLPPPEIISVPTATAGTVSGNPPGILIVKALVTPPPKRPGARR